MAILILNHDPALSSFNELTTSDVFALVYSSIFGTAISFGVFFYNATKGNAFLGFILLMLDGGLSGWIILQQVA